MFQNSVFKLNVNTKKWFRKTMKRTVATMLEAGLAAIPTTAVLVQEVNWLAVLSVMVLSGIVTFAKCMVVGVEEAGAEQREREGKAMRDITVLHPRLQAAAGQLKAECERQGIFILFSECLRTKAEQDALYAQGRTVPGSIVTNAKGSTYSSQHQWGIAIDFYIDMDVDGDGSKKDDAFNNATGLFERVGAIAKSVGLGWGGEWKSFKDRPHLYLPDWGSTTKQLKAEYGTPEKFMAAWENGGTVSDAINTVTGYERTQFILEVQQCTGSKVDGKAGRETIGNTPTVSRTINKNHEVVTALERRLKVLGYYDGAIEAEEGKTPCFGGGMERAVNRYQREVLGYENPDGEITARKKMWKSLLGMI